MTFYWGYDATILFPWWQCSTALEFYISCLCIFLVCLGSSKLKAICHKTQQGKPKSKQTLPVVSCSSPSVATATGSATETRAYQGAVSAELDGWSVGPPLLQTSTPEGLRHLGTAKFFTVVLLTSLSVIIDWAMMLVCMTFNAGLFLAVVAGVATGQMLLQHGSDTSSNCCSATTHG